MDGLSTQITRIVESAVFHPTTNTVATENLLLPFACETLILFSQLELMELHLDGERLVKVVLEVPHLDA